MMTDYDYQFPTYAKTPVTVGKQIAKIEEETREVRLATDMHEVIKETFNVIHAGETLLHQCDQKEVQEAYREVIQDNEARGYYTCEKSSSKSE